MKTLLTLQNGAVTVVEDAGIISLNFNEALGGGKSAGIVKGTGSVILNAQAGLQLAEQLLNAHLPASMQALAPIIETVINQAVASLE